MDQQQPYEVVERSSVSRSRTNFDWDAITATVGGDSAVRIPMDGVLQSTLHAALHPRAKQRGLKAHVRTFEAEKVIAVWVERDPQAEVTKT